MSPLTTTDPRWLLPETVEAIAAGPDWEKKVRVFWRLVSPEAHKLAHPRPVFGCFGCTQGMGCPRCGLSVTVCEDPDGDSRLSREGEASLLVGLK